jgi:hypothetical protein
MASLMTIPNRLTAHPNLPTPTLTPSNTLTTLAYNDASHVLLPFFNLVFFFWDYHIKLLCLCVLVVD